MLWFWGFFLVFLPLQALGQLVIHLPLLGLPILAGFAWGSCAALRAWRTRRRLRYAAAGFLCAAAVVGASVQAAAVADHIEWTNWFASGAGVRQGMTLDEVRGAVGSRGGRFFEEREKSGRLVFQLYPTGLARLDHVGLVPDLYYLYVDTDASQRVASVRVYHDH